METFISVLALLLTFCSFWIQRIHNEKSLKPLGQIELGDNKKRLYVHIQNNGLGPLIVDKLVFINNGIQYGSISDCLELNAKSYWHTFIDSTLKKVIQPDSFLVVFEKNIENLSDEEIDQIRKQLSPITLKLYYRDIYDNKFSFEKNLLWFSRHLNDKENHSNVDAKTT